jgi:hypothetical protein
MLEKQLASLCAQMKPTSPETGNGVGTPLELEMQ